MWVIKLANLYWSGQAWVHRQPEAMRFGDIPDLSQQHFPQPRAVELEPFEPRLSDTSSGGNGNDGNKGGEKEPIR